jgi:hypothetical protein
MTNILEIIFKNNYLKYIKKLLLGFLWILFFASINISPENINELSLVEILRLVIPPLLILIFLIYNFKKKIILFNIETFYIFFAFIIYFILGIYFILTNPNINSYLNIYWGVLMLTSFIYIFFFKNNLYQLKIFLLFSLLLNFFYFSFNILQIANFMIYKKEIINLYGITHHAIQTPDIVINISLSSGLSRLSIILYISLFIYIILTKKKFFTTNLIYIITIFLGFFGLAFQSRTMSLILYIFFILLIIIYFKKKNLANTKCIIHLIIIPFLLMIFYSQYLLKKEDIHKNIEKNLYEKNLDIFEQTVIRKSGQDFSSGRFSIWKKIIEISKENVIKGYGFQADRKLINDSAHNVYFYSLISGGLISLLLTIFISIRGGWTSFTILINFIFSNKKYYAFDLIPVFLIPLFLIRGIFESSYGIYSIDYLFFILCFFINEINYKKIIY